MIMIIYYDNIVCIFFSIFYEYVNKNLKNCLRPVFSKKPKNKAVKPYRVLNIFAKLLIV